MHYTLHQLDVFLKVVQSRSITKAAEELHLSQPAVSIQLKNFQQQFDIPLTEVIGRKLYVTDFGEEIAVAAERILNEVYGINYKTLAYKGQMAGRIVISSVSTGKYIMPFLLSDFLKVHPSLELKLDVTNRQQVIEDLENNRVDFALMSVLPEHIPLHRIELIANELIWVANREFDLSAFDGDLRFFERTQLISREPGSGTRWVTEQFFREHHLKITSSLVLTSNEAVKQAVLAGLGCAIMPIIGIRDELRSGALKVIESPHFPLTSQWQLVWLKHKKHGPAASSYIDFLISQKQEIIEKAFGKDLNLGKVQVL
jgi:DNA-binding transcriptional LysR family regulator